MIDVDIDAAKIVAILRGVSPDEIIAIGEVLIESGISVFEIPLNSPNPVESVKRAARHFAGRAIVGAGTVLTMHDVDTVADAGGQIVVSPNMNPDVIAQTRKRGLLSYPGIMTPTEAFAALSAGASGLKLFPGGAVGPGFIKALRAVLPSDAKLCAVGGVSADNVDIWFDAGVDLVGIGSGIYKTGDSAEAVSKKARAIVAAVHAAV